MKRRHSGIKGWLLAITLLFGTLLILFRDSWASPGHWWIGGANYQVKINDLGQGDYEIYRALNGDVLVICWDHMTEYYVSVSEQKVWEINHRQESTGAGGYLLYFRHSLTSEGMRKGRLKPIAAPAYNRTATTISFTDALAQRVTLSL